jgi:hypothetical protein
MFSYSDGIKFFSHFLQSLALLEAGSVGIGPPKRREMTYSGLLQMVHGGFIKLERDVHVEIRRAWMVGTPLRGKRGAKLGARQTSCSNRDARQTCCPDTCIIVRDELREKDGACLTSGVFSR